MNEMLNTQDFYYEFVNKAKKALGSNLLSLLLYGSAAKNMNTAESDIDLFAVVVNSGDEDELFTIAAEFLKKGILFSIISETPGELKKLGRKNSPFLNTIYNEGILLYGQRPDKIRT